MDAGKLTLLQVNLFLLARQRLAGGWGVGAILLEQRRDEDPSWITACHRPPSHRPAALGLGDSPVPPRGGTGRWRRGASSLGEVTSH